MLPLRGTTALLALTAMPLLAQAAPKLTTLYSFKDYADGAGPSGSLITIGHGLYGVTAGGNIPDCPDGDLFGCGILYSLDLTTGNETVAHRFNGGADGRYPSSGLSYRNGLAYGSTFGGGASDLGTLFSFDPKTGRESVLLTFSPLTGSRPSWLIWFHNKIYGAVNEFQGNPWGAIFKFDPADGKQSLVYNFKVIANGWTPEPGAILNDGRLFGVTELGGLGGAGGNGTVFTIDTKTGREKPIYDFPANQNPSEPTSLLAVGDSFYGTTWQGGAGSGSVFKISRQGVISNFYSFKGGTDGAYPYSGLTLANGALYGTTEYGGRGNCSGAGGCGTVFRIDLTTGTETVLYAFQGGTGGSTPSSPLIHAGNAWYGTTYGGGTDNSATCTFPPEGENGCGTVFKLTE